MFKDEVYRLVGDEYVVLGEYVKAKVKIKMLHRSCNKTFKMTPDNFKHGQRCPHCFGNKRKTTEQFKEEVFKLVGNEYIVVGEYITNKTPIRLYHTVCGKEFEIIPKQFLYRGQRCTNCQKYIETKKKLAKTLDQFKKEVFDLVQDEYEVIGEYVNYHTHILMLHNICGKKFEVTPANFLQGRRCPHCKQSKGEYLIQKWLEDNKIEYKIQYKFDDCVYKKPLSFDFAVFKDGKLSMLIEFDGMQHFEPIKGWGGRKKFEETKIKDSIKNKYCEDNNIKLIRIPYWDIDKIDIILRRELI